MTPPGPPPHALPMGELAVARSEGVLRTLLGSCIGVALYDRRLKVAGLSHIVLPTSMGRTDTPGKFADTAVPALIEKMRGLATGERLRLDARIAGGANMFYSESENTIGRQNQHAVERLLEELRIEIRGRHCGGEQGRRMIFDVATGAVRIDIVGAETITI
jgi:chemotaxis protein CheD